MKAGWLALMVALCTVGTQAWSQQTAPNCTRNVCELCFSPTEGCDNKLISYLDTAKDSLDIAIYSLTHAEIGNAIRRAQERGVRIRIIADYISSHGASSLVTELKDAGIPLKTWRGENELNGLMHHKFAVIDGKVLQTGSFNYTSNATKRNAENQIYIGDRATVRKFQGEFDRLWNQLH